MIKDLSENVDVLEDVLIAYILYKNDDYVLCDESGKSIEIHKLLNSLQPSFFSKRINRDIIEQIKTFYKKYSSVPSIEELMHLLKIKGLDYIETDFYSISSVNLFSFTREYLYSYIHTFLVTKTINYQLNKVSQKLSIIKPSPENIDSIYELVRNECSTNLEVEITESNDGLDVYDFRSHIQNKKNTVPTGFEYMDLVLGGGWEPKTLVCFFGKPKVGKSLVMSNLAVRTSSLGSNVGIYSVELGDRKYVKRIGSNLLGIPFTYYNDYNDEESTKDVEQRIIDYKRENPNAGVLHVKEAPTGSQTVYDIENYFLKQEAKLNKHFDVIFVDYVNLLRDVENETNMYIKIKRICEGLRKIAQRNNWCVVTATQANKQNFTNDDLGLDAVAESAGLVATVDTLIGLSSNDSYQLKMKTVANRDNGHMGSSALYIKNFDFYRLEEDGDNYMEELDDTHELLKRALKKEYDSVTAVAWTPEKNTEATLDGKPLFEHSEHCTKVDEAQAQAEPVQPTVKHEMTQNYQEQNDMPNISFSDDILDEGFGEIKKDPQPEYKELENEVNYDNVQINTTIPEDGMNAVVWTPDGGDSVVSTEVKEDEPVKWTPCDEPVKEEAPVTWSPSEENKKSEEKPDIQPSQITNPQQVINNAESPQVSALTSDFKNNLNDDNFYKSDFVNAIKNKAEHDRFKNVKAADVVGVLQEINNEILSDPPF